MEINETKTWTITMGGSFPSGRALEVDAFFNTTTEVNAAIVSPIFIRISRDRIELLVYPPIRVLERDEHQLPQNYEAPDAYLLEKSEASAFGLTG